MLNINFVIVLLLCGSQSVPKIYCQKMSSSGGDATAFPDSLKGFGYTFNANGELRQIDAQTGLPTDRPFQFDVSENPNYNQQRYEAIGDVITEHVYQLLEADLGLHKIYVPPATSDATLIDSSFIFSTKTDFSDTKKLLILIHGTGVVRAGQWSRSLIINHSLDHGTQIPYIKRAISLGYDVLITNTNHNYRYEANSNRRIAINGNDSPIVHAISVWEQLIAPALDSIEGIAIVAHSFGGVVTLDLAKRYSSAFQEKCFAVGFTDSVHSTGTLSTDLMHRLKENARNWVTSSKPLDTPIDSARNRDIPRYSAGHTKHEWTSWACIDALFAFLEKNYSEWLKKKKTSTNATKSDEL